MWSEAMMPGPVLLVFAVAIGGALGWLLIEWFKEGDK